MEAHPSVIEASASDGAVDLIVIDARRVLPDLLTAMARAGAAVGNVEMTEPDLEAVFLHLTGKGLRD